MEMGEALSPEGLAAVLPRSACLLGLDPGARLLGVAVSDSGRRVAVPLTTLERERGTAGTLALARALAALAAEHKAGGLVVGLPLRLDGVAGAQARSTRAIMRNLAATGVLELPWCWWDERLSSAAVARAAALPRAGRPSRADTKGRDAEAAAWILQGAIDRLAVI